MYPVNSDLIPDPIQYGDRALEREHLAERPLELFRNWMAEAVGAGIPEANAVCLCTVDSQGDPDARIVLVKEVSELGLTFFTNYQSAKGLQLEAHQRAAMVFFWQPLRRQVRLRGSVVKISGDESDRYYASRPRDSQLGAWASQQSRELAERAELEARVEEFSSRFPEQVPRPEHWGGFRLVPDRVEFWQGRDNRLHDRFVYRRSKGEGWSIVRLMP